MSDNEVSFGGAALACNSTLEATRWLPGSYKPVSRRINDSKVARIKAGGLRAVYCNPGEHWENSQLWMMTTGGHNPSGYCKWCRGQGWIKLAGGAPRLREAHEKQCIWRFTRNGWISRNAQEYTIPPRCFCENFPKSQTAVQRWRCQISETKRPVSKNSNPSEFYRMAVWGSLGGQL